PGGALRSSSSPHSTGCGGSITTGYSSPSAGCHRPSTRRPIGAQETRGPCWRLSNNQVSDKPGAVHPGRWHHREARPVLVLVLVLVLDPVRWPGREGYPVLVLDPSRWPNREGGPVLVLVHDPVRLPRREGYL